MSKENKFAFPDTNIFLHFQFFTEIAWIEVLQAKSVTLVIPPVVAKELDKHKYNHSSERVKDRANKVTKKFAEILRSNREIRPKVNIQFETTVPQSEFKKYNLSKESQDDHLIASILRFQNESGNTAVLITNDFSLLVKAHQLNIMVIELSESYQIKSEENPDKKKIAKLEKELFELKVKIPRLKLVSEDDKERIISQKLSVEKFSDEDIKNEIVSMNEKYPEIIKTYKPKKVITRINGKPYPNKVEFNLPSGEIKQADLSSVEKYNNKLEQFYEDYEKYLNEKLRINNLRNRTVKFRLKLKNEGTLPANGVHVILTFPKEFKVTTNENIFSYPKEINPPQFDTMADIFSKSFSAEQLIPNYSSLFIPKIPKVEMPWEKVNIKRKDSIYSASFQSVKLSHGYSLDCPETIYVIFPQSQTAKPFQIKYKIAADNLPTAIEGKINILVNNQK